MPPAPTLTIPGGLYGEALPSGAYAVLVPSTHIQTHLGNVALPPGEGWGPLFLRIWEGGGVFKMAGQGHMSGQALEWTSEDRTWHRRGPTVGVSPVIYDHQGRLHISLGEVGSQGFRYVTARGEIVSGDDTYYSPTLRLHEYTTYDGLTIGQGMDGAIAVKGGERRKLTSGSARFLRYTKAGDTFALYVSQPGQGVIYRLPVADLVQFPLEAPPPPPPVPPSPPDPMPTIPNLKHVVERLRRDYPTPLGSRHAHFLAHLTQALKAESGLPIGLLKKSGGTVVQMPSGVTVAQDIITVHQGDHLRTFDVLGSGETEAKPGWSPTKPTGIDRDLSRFYLVSAADLEGPAPTPPPPPLDLLALIGQLQETLGVQEIRLAKLEAAPPPPPLPADLVRLGHAVEVDGEVSFLGFRRPVKARGVL